MLWIGIMLAGVVFNLRSHLLARREQRRRQADEAQSTENGQDGSDDVHTDPLPPSRQSSAFSIIVPDCAPSLSMRLRRRLRV